MARPKLDNEGSALGLVESSRQKKRSSKKRSKNVALKSDTQTQTRKPLQPRGERKQKGIRLKEKSVTGKHSISGQLKSLSHSSVQKTDRWLANLNCQESKFNDSGAKDPCFKSIEPVDQKVISNEDSDMASTLEVSLMSQDSDLPERSSSENSDLVVLEEHLGTSGTATQVLPCKSPIPEGVNGSSKNINFPPVKESTAGSITSEKANDTTDPTLKIKRVSKGPLSTAKRIKSKKNLRRKEFLKFYLKNSQNGFHQASKKFYRKKLSSSQEHKRADGASTRNLEAVGPNNGIKKDVPLKVVVKERLSSSDVAQSLGPSAKKFKAATPTPTKLLRRVSSQTPKSRFHHVTSCQVPFESPVGVSSHGEETHDNGTSVIIEDKASHPSKRDVCYIFALLDRENEETLFKCSPHLKSSTVLEQFANVIDSISADDDLMLTKKMYPTDKHTNRPSTSDRSTSPILFPDLPSEEASQFAFPRNPSARLPPTEDVPILNEDENSDDSGMQSDVEKRHRVVNATTKVLISKALLNFTSELKVLTDISIRLLGWLSKSIKADLDSDSFEDEFEGYLCHCHDKVSILIECLSELDSRHILNIDEVELKRFWLLHDALRCMLQAYRYVQSPSSSPQLRQKLLSLMVTCSKTILPSVSIPLSRWVVFMTMISGISKKLCDARLLSNACLCYQHFESLKRDRSCGMCDLQNLYQELCKGESPEPKHLTGNKSKLWVAKASVMQLFPRFCWFLSEVEGLSKEEFMAAFEKHSVVKFSCNAQSGLNPCDQHVSDIVCTCFAVSTDGELNGPAHQSDGIGSEGEANNGRNDLQHALNESADQQIVPLCAESTEGNSSNGLESLNKSLSEGQKIDSTSMSNIAVVSIGSSDSSTTSEVTVDLRKDGSKPQESNCASVMVNGEGSSEDFSLHLEESSGHIDPQNCVQLDNEEDAAVIDEEERNCSTLTHASESRTGQVLSDCSVSLSSNFDVDYSPLNFHAAKSNILKAVSNNGRCSTLSVSNSEAVSAEEDSTIDVSIGDEDSFELSSDFDIKGHRSIGAKKGADSASASETLDFASVSDAHSSQELEDNSTRKVLRSPPLFNVDSSVEDSVSSQEMPSMNSRIMESGVSSSQEKDEEVQEVPLYDFNASAYSTPNNDQIIQRMRKDCKESLRRAMWSVSAGPRLEANTWNLRNTRARMQKSSSEAGERTSIGKKIGAGTNENAFKLVSDEQNQQILPNDARNLDSNGPGTNLKGRKVTFNDILQFKEFRNNSPISKYGRRNPMPENFSESEFKEKVNSLLESMYSSEVQNCVTIQKELSDDDHCTPLQSAGNYQKSEEEGSAPSVCKEEDFRKYRKGKLSLRSFRATPSKEVKEKEIPKCGLTNNVFEKLKQVTVQEEKFRMAFDQPKNKDRVTESSLDSKMKTKTESHLGKNVKEDTNEKQPEEGIDFKNAKKSKSSHSTEQDVALQSTMTAEPALKSCLKKSSRTSGSEKDSEFSPVEKPVLAKREKSHKVKPESGSVAEDQVMEMMQTRPTPTQERDQDSASVQNGSSLKKVKGSIQREQKESKDHTLRQEKNYLTEERKGSLKSSYDHSASQTSKKQKSNKGKKDKLVSQEMEGTASELFTTVDLIEVKSNATTGKKGSKKSKSHGRKGDSRSDEGEGGKAKDLNVSDPEWKSYISDLKGRMLDKSTN